MKSWAVTLAQPQSTEMEETDDTRVVTEVSAGWPTSCTTTNAREEKPSWTRRFWKKARKTNTRTTTLSFPMMSIVIAGTKRTKAMQTRRPVSGRNGSWSIATKKNKTTEKNKRDEMVNRHRRCRRRRGIHVVRSSSSRYKNNHHFAHSCANNGKKNKRVVVV